MFVYLSKKIAIPHNLALHVLSWNEANGWIACGGERGLLKVLKLDGHTQPGDQQQQQQPPPKGTPGQSNLSMNQTLEGHQGNIMVVTWNEHFRKLTTSDQNGLIIVWMLHRGIWFEEMINNRNRSVVRDMKWTPDGQKICIVYEDGAVIVGTVDGQRLWGREVKTQLAFVEWSPDSKNILFCTLTGEVHVYDNEGIYSHKVAIHCLDEGTHTNVPVAGIQWYDGHRGPEPTVPALAIAFENGRVQLMRCDTDDRPILLDTQMKCSALRWSPSGTAVTIAGMQAQGETTGEGGSMREVGVVQFYSPMGQHLRTLRVPGHSLKAISWDGAGLRIALAVDSHIFFANIRPDYLAAYFSHTLVYAVLKKERNEYAVIFWDTRRDERYTKYIKKLLHVKAGEDYCVLATKTEEAAEQHILIVCNDIGSPVQSQYLTIEPLHVCMTSSHVMAASEDTVYIWQYRSSLPSRGGVAGVGDTLTLTATSASTIPPGSASAGLVPQPHRRRVEQMFHIDEYEGGASDKEAFRHPGTVCQDPIACIAASDSCLVVGRESGTVQRYSLPHLALDGKVLIQTRPQVLAVNCASSCMTCIDINGILTLYNIQHRGKGQMGEQLDFERKDVWDMRWASDNPDLFALMEKTRMYVVRGTDPEEPVLSNGYICSFKDLHIQSALIDDLMKNPDSAKKDILLEFDTKSLRDTSDILTKVSNLKDAFTYVEENPHPRLWRLLAEAALDQLELSVAEKAFVRYEEYQGIQFVKRLRMLDDKVKQKAEVAAYFQRFDEAEHLYFDIDRKDLALDLRIKLGDWFRVIQLTQGGAGAGASEILHRAYSEIGDYYADRGKWLQASQYYAKAGNNAALVEAYYLLEDYEKLRGMIDALPEGDPLLAELGRRLTTVGLCEAAVGAFLRVGDVKAAVDSCVILNQWDLAVDLAEKHSFQQIETLLAKYAQHLLDKTKKLEAVQLYRRANRHQEAARLLAQVGKTLGPPQFHPDRHKKLHLLAALEVEKYKKKTFDGGGAGGTNITAQTLNSLITQVRR
mmetsp:Transcript_10684/g.30908  ORF Transcript_10684/g.30908 Transcript_10684/m.30908 type:complete len:1031 (+) Transcript_10684:210-3302(+)